MTNHFDIINSIAFVTGTNKNNGIGRAFGDALLEHDGAKKIYATAQDAAQLEDLVLSSNGRFVAVSLDVTADDEQTGNLGEQYPDVNLVANNAGYFGSTSTLDIPENGAIQEMQVNYFAPLNIVCSFSLANSRCSQTNCFHCKSSQLCSGWHILRSSLLQGGIALLDSSLLLRLGDYFKNRCIPWAYWYCHGRRGRDISSANRNRRYLPQCHVSSTSWGMASRGQGPLASHGSSNESFRLKMLQKIYPVFYLFPYFTLSSRIFFWLLRLNLFVISTALPVAVEVKDKSIQSLGNRHWLTFKRCLWIMWVSQRR